MAGPPGELAAPAGAVPGRGAWPVSRRIGPAGAVEAAPEDTAEGCTGVAAAFAWARGERL